MFCCFCLFCDTLLVTKYLKIQLKQVLCCLICPLCVDIHWLIGHRSVLTENKKNNITLKKVRYKNYSENELKMQPVSNERL